MRKVFLINFFFFCSLSFLSGEAQQNTHSDKKATKETVNLYNNLKKLSAKGFMFGHQDDLAYGAGISRSYLSQLEKGTFYASLKIVGRLAEAMAVDPAEFLVLRHG